MDHALIFGVHDMMPHRFLGPHRIAHYLRNNGWDIEVVDFASFWTLEQLKNFIKSRIHKKTKFIGFGCWFGNWPENIDMLSHWIKDYYPEIKIIYGSHTYPKFNNESIDYYTVGYAEKAIIQLANYFQNNGTIKFDTRWENKKIILANDTYPAFPMNELGVIYEHRDLIEPWEWLTIEFTRGCKFSCKFCNYPILGVKDDHSTAASDFEYTVKDAYDKFGVTNYYTADETLNQDKSMIEKYANVADTLNFKLRMHGFMRADLLIANKDTWDPLSRLGVFGHMYGIETFNKKTGSSVGKGMDPLKVKEGLLEIREWFDAIEPYRGNINMVCGLPFETKETWESGIEWLMKNWTSKGDISATYALEIPLSSMDSKLSFISNNWKALGYRRRKTPSESLHAVSSLKYADELLDWENDYMDLDWAVKSCNTIYKQYKVDMGVSVWHWGDHGLMNLSFKDLQKKQKHYNQWPNKELEDFLQRYIKKKIEL